MATVVDKGIDNATTRIPTYKTLVASTCRYEGCICQISTGRGGLTFMAKSPIIICAISQSAFIIHTGLVQCRAERQSARMSKITNGGLNRGLAQDAL